MNEDAELTSKEGVYIEADKDDQLLANWSRFLGYAGLMPFVACAFFILVFESSYQQLATKALLSYAAVIITFIGALHWARALLLNVVSDSVPLLIISVIPSLVAWVALLLNPTAAFVMLILSFIAMLIFDRIQWRFLPWFLQLRMHLSLGAITCLIIGLLANL